MLTDGDRKEDNLRPTEEARQEAEASSRLRVQLAPVEWAQLPLSVNDRGRCYSAASSQRE
jgi:hypothetical protein